MSLGTGATVISLSASSRHYSAVVATCRGARRGLPVGRFVPPSYNFAHYCPTPERLLPRQTASHRSSVTNSGVPKLSTHEEFNDKFRSAQTKYSQRSTISLPQFPSLERHMLTNKSGTFARFLPWYTVLKWYDTNVKIIIFRLRYANMAAMSSSQWEHRFSGFNLQTSTQPKFSSQITNCRMAASSAPSSLVGSCF